MTSPALTLWPGLAPLASRYDVFLIDLWGVIHDGVRPYPGACDALERLKAAGRATVLLSNAPRRSRALVEIMEKMGIPRSSYTEILTSGEVVYQGLRDRTSPPYAGLGPSLFFIGQDRDANLFEGLSYRRVGDPGEADFVLTAGPFDLSDAIGAYEALCARCAGLGLPMICANPDREAIRDGQRVICAGTIADLFVAKGGRAEFVGKPGAAVYARALDTVGAADKGRAVGVGDSLVTDIAGCVAAGIDGVLVTGGIHAERLGIVRGETAPAERIAALAAEYGAAPVGAIPAFVW